LAQDKYHAETLERENKRAGQKAGEKVTDQPPKEKGPDGGEPSTTSEANSGDDKATDQPPKEQGPDGGEPSKTSEANSGDPGAGGGEVGSDDELPVRRQFRRLRKVRRVCSDDEEPGGVASMTQTPAVPGGTNRQDELFQKALAQRGLGLNQKDEVLQVRAEKLSAKAAAVSLKTVVRETKKLQTDLSKCAHVLTSSEFETACHPLSAYGVVRNIANMGIRQLKKESIAKQQSIVDTRKAKIESIGNRMFRVNRKLKKSKKQQKKVRHVKEKKELRKQKLAKEAGRLAKLKRRGAGAVIVSASQRLNNADRLRAANFVVPVKRRVKANG
jgi:hypothetical protein